MLTAPASWCYSMDASIRLNMFYILVYIDILDILDTQCMYFEVQSFVTVETSSENGVNYMYRTHPEPLTTEEVGLVNRLVICLYDNIQWDTLHVF